MNLVKMEELVRYLIGPSFVLHRHGESLEILREAVSKLAPPERSLIRSYYLGEVTLPAEISEKSKYVYLLFARRSLAAALTADQKIRLKDSCTDILLDCYYTRPETWTKSSLAKMWFPFDPNRLRKVGHLIRLASESGIIQGSKDGFTPEEAGHLAGLLVERRRKKWRSKQKAK